MEMTRSNPLLAPDRRVERAMVMKNCEYLGEQEHE